MTSFDLNAKLLLSLDETSRSWLVNTKSFRMWMVPVALYEKIDLSVTGGNQVSFIDVKIRNGSDLSAVKKELRNQLKTGNYWGTILTLKPAKYLGVTLFSLFLRFAHLTFRRTGTLTNMGEWKLPSLPADEWWIFGDGMVAVMNPVVATAMIVNGHLGLSVIMHESLGKTEADARSFLDQWIENLESKQDLVSFFK